MRRIEGATSRFIGLALTPPTIAGFLHTDLGTGQFKVWLPAEPTVCGQVQSESHNKSWTGRRKVKLKLSKKLAASEGEIETIRNRRKN